MNEFDFWRWWPLLAGGCWRFSGWMRRHLRVDVRFQWPKPLDEPSKNKKRTP